MTTFFLEGKGFFLTKTPEGRSVYTRLGEFTFDGEGVYRAKMVIQFKDIS